MLNVIVFLIAITNQFLNIGAVPVDSIQIRMRLIINDHSLTIFGFFPTVLVLAPC